MADVFTKTERSAVMRSVTSKNTSPEKRVVAAAKRLRHRFQQHYASLPGKPDLVFPRSRLAVFVHGCFWHGHPGCKHSARPASNRAYWSQKLDRNRLRDQRHRRALNRLGWSTMVIWECQSNDGDSVAERIAAALQRAAHRRKTNN